jgi:hypothetical protein
MFQIIVLGSKLGSFVTIMTLDGNSVASKRLSAHWQSSGPADSVLEPVRLDRTQQTFYQLTSAEKKSAACFQSAGKVSKVPSNVNPTTR